MAGLSAHKFIQLHIFLLAARFVFARQHVVRLGAVLFHTAVNVMTVLLVNGLERNAVGTLQIQGDALARIQVPTKGGSVGVNVVFTGRQGLGPVGWIEAPSVAVKASVCVSANR